MTRSAMMFGLVAGFGLVAAGARDARAQEAGAGSAAALESAAAVVLADGADCRGAADLYRRAASLRPGDDPRQVEDLRLAGLLYVQAGRLRPAGAALEKAGERALAEGRLDDAALAFADAAYVAARAGSGPAAAILAHRALWLADMDGVSDAHRDLIRRRFGPAMAAYVGA